MPLVWAWGLSSSGRSGVLLYFTLQPKFAQYTVRISTLSFGTFSSYYFSNWTWLPAECPSTQRWLTRLTCWVNEAKAHKAYQLTACLSFLVLSGESSDPVSTPLTSSLRDMMRILPIQLCPVLYLTFSFVLLARPSAPLQPQVVQRAPDPELHPSSATLNASSKRACSGEVVCRPGIVLPVWLPLNPPVGEQAGRAVVYFSCLMYMFLGVSIIADRFMASIEVITSQVLMISVFTANNIAILSVHYSLRKISFLIIKGIICQQSVLAVNCYRHHFVCFWHHLKRKYMKRLSGCSYYNNIIVNITLKHLCWSDWNIWNLAFFIIGERGDH